MTTTNRNESAYTVGDWIVHLQHGIGQIAGRTVNDISGEETVYYTLKTKNSVVWIPADRLSSEEIRPLATPEEMQEVINILTRPARSMDENMRKRKSRIRQVEEENSPLEVARLIRDLRARRSEEGKLYAAERRALRSLTKRLIHEWAAAFKVGPEIAKQSVTTLLQSIPPNQDLGASASGGGAFTDDPSFVDASREQNSMRPGLLNRQLEATEQAPGD